jgi:hypothetical protein
MKRIRRFIAGVSVRREGRSRLPDLSLADTGLQDGRNHVEIKALTMAPTPAMAIEWPVSTDAPGVRLTTTPRRSPSLVLGLSKVVPVQAETVFHLAWEEFPKWGRYLAHGQSRPVGGPS